MSEIIELNAKQKLFVDNYLSGKSQYESIKLAGYTGKNDNVLSSIASRMLKSAKIQRYVELQRKKLEIRVQNKYDLTQDHLVKGYNVILDNLQLIIDSEDTDKRTKVAALKAQKDTKDSLTRIAGLFNDKLQTVVTVKELKDLTLDQMEELIKSIN